MRGRGGTKRKREENDGLGSILLNIRGIYFYINVNVGLVPVQHEYDHFPCKPGQPGAGGARARFR